MSLFLFLSSRWQIPSDTPGTATFLLRTPSSHPKFLYDFLRHALSHGERPLCSPPFPLSEFYMPFLSECCLFKYSLSSALAFVSKQPSLCPPHTTYSRAPRRTDYLIFATSSPRCGVPSRPPETPFPPPLFQWSFFCFNDRLFVHANHLADCSELSG